MFLFQVLWSLATHLIILPRSVLKVVMSYAINRCSIHSYPLIDCMSFYSHWQFMFGKTLSGKDFKIIFQGSVIMDISPIPLRFGLKQQDLIT